MFERFTDHARRVVVMAQDQARRLDHGYIGTEHILLGLIGEGSGVAAKALESPGLSLESVLQQVKEIIGQGQGQPTLSDHLPFTPRAKKVLELSLREALTLGHDYIGTEHILLGLIREGEGVAVQVLARLGADLNHVRQQVIRLLAPQITGAAQHRTMSGLRLGEAVTAALRLASSRRPPNRSLTTGQVFAALAQVDPANDWQRLWLHTGAPEDLGLAEAADLPDLGPSTSWEDVPLSPNMTAALSRLTQLCAIYDLAPATTGLLALAIAMDPDSGATRILRRAGLPHLELLDMVQADIVGSHLDGLAEIVSAPDALPEPGTEGGPEVPDSAPAIWQLTEWRAVGRAADELDLLAVLVSHPASAPVLERLGLYERLIEAFEEPVRAIGLTNLADLTRDDGGDGADGSALRLTALLAASPSRGLSWLFRLVGVDRGDVAAEVMDAAEIQADHRQVPGLAVTVLSIMSLVLSLVVSALVVIDAVGPGSFWELFLLPLVWLGYPRWPSPIALVIALPIALAVTPTAGAVQVVAAVADWVYAHARRQQVMSRTGVVVSPAAARRVAVRQLARGRRSLALWQRVQVRWYGPRLLREAARCH